ncbi:MAG TPA: metal ABC transporter ATP-binding protein [Bacillota bacterium]|nr:metal ABC transporter ATP-binding protein [Bacillota bacterium]
MTNLPKNLDQQYQKCGLCHTSISNFGVTRGGTEILRDVNITVHCGELTALIGPNGGGKSTLLKSILGEIPHSGQLRFADSSGKRLGRPRIGYVPQRLDFDSSSPISVLDLFAASQTKVPVWLFNSGRLARSTQEALSRVQAEHLIYRRLGDLSGGELQRVLLALALLPMPDLLLLDEPVSGIDQQGLELFYKLVSDIRDRYDLSIILVSHDLHSVAHYADRIVFLNKTVQCCGTPGEVFSDNTISRLFGEVLLEGLFEGRPMVRK